MDTWDAPFFYEDRKNLFYVTTTEAVVSFGTFTGYGAGFTSTNAGIFSTQITPVVQQPPVSPTTGVALSRFAPRVVECAAPLRGPAHSPALVT